MPNEIITRVVRAIGAERVHVADAHAGQVRVCRMFGSTFLGLELPLATRCGAVLRARDVAVCMEAGARVTCAPCRRLSGVDRAAEDNTRYAGLTAESLQRLAD